MTGMPKYAYVALADRIAADIASGKLPVGARLPGEREATELYRVSIGTWRRTVRYLREERHLVATLPAKGTYVVAAPE
ncbi:GntR family transcriptional regulator [Streptomyces griseoluteus]|uniref:GntR family transcriptional regulator n=1 Tax=Streptomyces griseoluteus TaxID=29306 RepID=UPI0036B057B1